MRKRIMNRFRANAQAGRGAMGLRPHAFLMFEAVYCCTSPVTGHGMGAGWIASLHPAPLPERDVTRGQGPGACAAETNGIRPRTE